MDQVIYRESDEYETVIPWDYPPNGVSCEHGQTVVKLAKFELLERTRYVLIVRQTDCVEVDNPSDIFEEILFPAFTPREQALRMAIEKFDSMKGKYAFPHKDKENHPEWKEGEEEKEIPF